jgi:hypothetical protein
MQGWQLQGLAHVELGLTVMDQESMLLVQQLMGDLRILREVSVMVDALLDL